jgi:hypothetical protein
MLAEKYQRESSYAEASARPASKLVPRDSYEATEPGKTTDLVFPGPRMQMRTEIVAAARRYELDGVFVVNIEYLEDDIVFVSHRTVPVHAYGNSLAEALGTFGEAFDMQWRSLVDVAETSLTAGGVKRRRAMEGVVARVSNVE